MKMFGLAAMIIGACLSVTGVYVLGIGGINQFVDGVDASHTVDVLLGLVRMFFAIPCFWYGVVLIIVGVGTYAAD